MKLIRMFVLFVVVSLIVGLGNAFSGKSNTKVLEENYTKQSEIKKTEIKQEKSVVENDNIPDDLNSTTTNKEKFNTENNLQQQSEMINENQNKSSNTIIENSNNIFSDSNYENNTTIIEEQTVEKTNEQTIEHQKEEEKIIVDNSVDTTSLDYNSHKGRIDCNSSQECMNISLPIQFRFKQSITNSFYVDVIANSGISLGYFIEYVFKENTYSSEEECEKIGNEIKETLQDRVISYQCNGSTLKINTDY